jgi:hypothetical protein
VPRNQEEHRKNSARESFDEHRILNAEPTSPEFLAATVHELQPSPVAIQQFQQPQPSWQLSQQFFPSVAGNSVNPATTANSRNLATTI